VKEIPSPYINPDDTDLLSKDKESNDNNNNNNNKKSILLNYKIQKKAVRENLIKMCMSIYIDTIGIH